MAAIEAIARRADVNPKRKSELVEDASLQAALADAANYHETETHNTQLAAQLRTRAAFALGVLGGEAARDQLVGLLADPEATVRYNAATGLARHGDERALPGILEMLQLTRETAADTSVDEGQQALEQTTIFRNALRAGVQLSEANPELDPSELRRAVDQLAESKTINPVVRRGIEADVRQAQLRLSQ